MPTTFETRLAFNRGKKKGRRERLKRINFKPLRPPIHVSVCRRGEKREKEKAIDSGVTPP